MPTNSRVRNQTMNEIDARSNGGKLSYDIKVSVLKALLELTFISRKVKLN